MAHPVDPGLAFFRDPKTYPHDAFGADTGGRTIPHTGWDFTAKSAANPGPAMSVYGGKVVEVGFDKEAGRYYITAERDGGFWVGCHLATLFVKSGDELEPGGRIGTLGNSGNSSGVHLHLARAKTLEAARNLIHGYVNYKRGRTITKWAESMGLTDPLPYIEKSPPPAQKDEGFLMALSDFEQKLIKNAVVDINNRTDRIEKALEAERAEAAAARALLSEVHSQYAKRDGNGWSLADVLKSHVIAINARVKELESEGVVIDYDRIARETVNEHAKRLAVPAA